MTLHPSTFPKRADGTRFVVTNNKYISEVRDEMGVLIAACLTGEVAQMIAAALEQVARDGETFDAEERPCK